MSSPFDAAVKKLLLSNLLFYFRVRIGPEALQLAAVVTLYFPGLMQARRLRLHHQHRQLSTRCIQNQEQTIRFCWGRVRLRGVEPSRLKFGWGCGDVTAIQGREK